MMKVRSLVFDKSCVSKSVCIEGPIGETPIGYVSRCSRKEDILSIRKILINFYLHKGDLINAYKQALKFVVCKNTVPDDPLLSSLCDDVLTKFCNHLGILEYRILSEYELLLKRDTT